MDPFETMANIGGNVFDSPFFSEESATRVRVRSPGSTNNNNRPPVRNKPGVSLGKAGRWAGFDPGPDWR